MEGFLGIHNPNAPSLYNSLEPKLRHQNILSSFKKIFMALSLQKPVIIEIEDLHWIDEDSINAFQFICRNIEDLPILFVISSRYNDDETKPKLPLNIPEVEIDLQTLSAEGTIEFAESILNGKLSDNLKENLLQKTQGNPFFVEQTIFFYRESNIISFDKQKQIWDIKVGKKAIPDTINDLIIARIDRLSTKLKEAVQTASVLGQEFEINLLMDVLSKVSTIWDEQDLKGFLKEGEHNKVWALLSEIKGIFAHALMRDVVYNMQLRSHLRRVHQLVAETLRVLFPKDKNIYADLAYHYEKAEMWNETMEYLEKAGLYARENFQNHKALEFFNKLIKMYEQDLKLKDKEISELYLDPKVKYKLEKYAELEVYHGYLLNLLGNTQESTEHYTLALKIAEQINDELNIGKLNLNLGANLLIVGNLEKSLSYFEKAKTIFEKHNDLEHLALIAGNIGLINLYYGNFELALEKFQEELTLVEKNNDEPGKARAIGHMGNAYDLMGEHAKAIEYFEEQLVISKKIQHKILESSALGDLGINNYYLGNYQKALDYYEKQLRLNEQIGHNTELSNAIGNAGLIYSDMGEFDKALQYYERKLNLCKEFADIKEISIVLSNMAEAYAYKGDTERALALYDEAIRIGKELDIKFFLCGYIVDEAELLLNIGKLDEAQKLCQEGYEMAKRTNRGDVIFKGKLLLTKLDYKLNKKGNVPEKLIKMLKETSGEEEKAWLNYELWEITQETNYKETALTLYHNLYINTPKYIFKKRKERLAGLMK